ncbi:MAG TPA: hypothetical protein VKU01_03365 [Bryobacteraceae bacterium]|nr:hypothetical protein [Bryobacteraceae bacterium]
MIGATAGRVSSAPFNVIVCACSVVGIGVALLLQGLSAWQCADSRRFLAYLAIAILGGMLKIKVPGTEGTFSLSFVAILISVGDLTFGETAVIGAVATAVQSFWKAKPRPTALQLSFNIGAFVISIAVCFLASRSAFAVATLRDNLIAQISVVTCVFFAVNTTLVSAVIATMERRPLWEVWHRWFAWSFPYYLTGAIVSGLVVISTHRSGWATSLLVLPIMLFVYAYHRMHAAHDRLHL